MNTENFAIAVYHFSSACSLQKWTAVAWEAFAVLKHGCLLNNLKLKNIEADVISGL